MLGSSRGCPAWWALLPAVLCGCSGDDRAATAEAAEIFEPRFEKITLHREFVCEGASFGDLDRDGHTDVVAGPDWFEGPQFRVRHALWQRVVFDPHEWSDCFFQWVRDLDADGWLDVLVVGFPGLPAYWYRNPGAPTEAWERRDAVLGSVDNESPEWVDVTGDGEPELVHMQGGFLGWSTPDASGAWGFRPLSEPRGYVTFTHGLGVGDVDGDGRADALEATGYFLQPPSPGGLWVRRDAVFGGGGAQMPVLDVDGDGDKDVVASLAAHGYGLSWFEQADGGEFTEHSIVPAEEPDAAAEVVIHQPHALAAGDLDGDGFPDVVTGERFWGHVPSGDPDFGEPSRLYWFRSVKNEQGARFEARLIDADSGVGTQVSLGDTNDDGRLDIVVANKKGAFLFLNRAGAKL